MTDWKNLESPGWLTVPNFLSTEEVNTLVAHFNDIKTKKSDFGESYDALQVGPEIMNYYRERLAGVMQAISEQTKITVNHLISGPIFHTERSGGFSWHTDHEPYWIFQSTFNYLNFWMPFIKPDPKKSNVSLIPFDSLKVQIPELYEMTFGKGAFRMRFVENKLILFDDTTGQLTDLTEFNDVLEEIAVTPNLRAGDALIVRGDVMHKTQDIDTDRAAVSIRCLNRHAIVNRNMLFEGMSSSRFSKMARARLIYEGVFCAYEIAGKDSMTIEEFCSITDNMAKRSQAPNLPQDKMLSGPDRLDFIKNLMPHRKINRSMTSHRKKAI